MASKAPKPKAQNIKLVNLPVPEGEEPVVVVGGDISAGGGATYAVVIVRIMYAAILSYSVLTSFICGHQWWLMCVWYLWGLVAFYLWHYQAHHQLSWVPFNDQCYRTHKEHHWGIYPPEHFFGRPGFKVVEDGWFGYFNPIQWVTAHEMLLYILMFGPVVVVKFATSMTASTTAAVVIGYLLMGLVGNYLHHAYHIKDVWLCKYQWFHELRAFHYVHHQGDARSNFAVLNMSLDRWLHSLSLGYEPQEELSHPPTEDGPATAVSTKTD